MPPMPLTRRAIPSLQKSSRSFGGKGVEGEGFCLRLLQLLQRQQARRPRGRRLGPVAAPSLLKMAVTWNLTVRSVMAERIGDLAIRLAAATNRTRRARGASAGLVSRRERAEWLGAWRDRSARGRCAAWTWRMARTSSRRGRAFQARSLRARLHGAVDIPSTSYAVNTMMWRLGKGGGESPHAGDAILARQVQIQQRDVGASAVISGRSRARWSRPSRSRECPARTEHRGHAVVDDR